MQQCKHLHADKAKKALLGAIQLLRPLRNFSSDDNDDDDDDYIAQ